MRLNDLPLRSKLWGLLLAVLAAMTAVTAYGLHAAYDQDEQTTARLRRADDLITMVTAWRGISQRNTELTLARFLNRNDDDAAFFDARLKAGVAESSALQDRIIASAASPRDKAQIQAMTDQRKALLVYVKKGVAMRQQGQLDAMRDFVDKEFTPAFVVYDQSQAAMLKLQETERDETLAQADVDLRRTVLTAAVLVTAVLLLAIVATLLLLRSITGPLRQTVLAAEAIATGDLRQQMRSDRRDEIGRLMQAMAEMGARLRLLVSEVREGVASVDSASSEIATGNQDLSARTEQTAASLQQTASSLQQVTGIVRRSTDIAGEADQLAASVQDAATRSGDAVGEVVARMDEISASSRKIAEITGVIDGIAFQTNILALNAAVEAARAGEQGRGFAVVAGEVRTLAQRSGEAAREIRQLIAQSAETVDAGARQVAQAKAVIDDVVGGVSRVAGLIGGVSQASNEQYDGLQQVNQAVGHIDQMTQQNAALVEEAAAAASSLRDQSRRLAQTVAVFKVDA